MTLRKLFEGFRVVLELPGSCCIEELLELYPNAKVCSLSRFLRFLPGTVVQTRVFLLK